MRPSQNWHLAGERSGFAQKIIAQQIIEPPSSGFWFAFYLERHRARDKAFLGGGIVQAAREIERV